VIGGERGKIWSEREEMWREREKIWRERRWGERGDIEREG
jgi:hypothetical protein